MSERLGVFRGTRSKAGVPGARRTVQPVRLCDSRSLKASGLVTPRRCSVCFQSCSTQIGDNHDFPNAAAYSSQVRVPLPGLRLRWKFRDTLPSVRFVCRVEFGVCSESKRSGRRHSSYHFRLRSISNSRIGARCLALFGNRYILLSNCNLQNVCDRKFRCAFSGWFFEGAAESPLPVKVSSSESGRALQQRCGARRPSFTL